MVRSLPRVITFVNDQGRVLGERFPASIASIRFLPRVGPLVDHQGAPLPEGLAANVADQQFLPAVKAQVILKRSFRRNRFTAQMALVFVLAHVGLNVQHQRILINESLPAELALMLHWLEIGIVDQQMLHQGMIIRERFVARMTNVFLGAVFHVHVTVEFRVREESFLAHLAVPGVFIEMSSVVGGQLKGLDERVSANVADEILLVGMDPPMDGQGVGPLEGLSADVALVRTSVAVGDQVSFVEILRPEELFASFALIERLNRRLF